MEYNVLVIKKGIAGVPKEMFDKSIHDVKAYVIIGFNDDGTVQKGEKIELPFVVGNRKDGTTVICEVDPEYFDNPSLDYVKKEYEGLGAIIETKGIKVEKQNIFTMGLWSTVKYLIITKNVYKKYEDLISPYVGIVEEIGDEEEG